MMFGSCIDPLLENHQNHPDCLWSRDECPSDEIWIAPRLEGIHDNDDAVVCTCDNVLVGACRFGQEYICAISADACDNLSQYITAKDLRKSEPTMDCRLCDQPTTIITTTNDNSDNEYFLESIKVGDDDKDCIKMFPVGACKEENGDFTCAASQKDCEKYVTWLSPDDKENVSSCYLCRFQNNYAFNEEELYESSPVDSSARPPAMAPSPQQQQENNNNAQKIISYMVPAGACVGDGHYLCAFERTHCPEGTDFVSARMLADEFKEDSLALSCIERGVDVPMGQCTKPVDNGMCTGHKTNCEGCYETANNNNNNVTSCFESNNLDCALGPSPDTSNSFAAFGLCQNTMNPSEGHCLWSEYECPSQKNYVWLRPTVENFCTCDQVDVGACRYGENNFICAVSAHACDELSEYIGAKQLRNIKPDLDCRLCEQISPIHPQSSVSTTTTTTTIPPSRQQQQTASSVTYYAVPAGACMSSTTDDYFCAFEKTHCPDGTNFVSARILDLDFKDSPALSCISHATTDLPMGQCTMPVDDKLCTGHPSNCEGCYSDDNTDCFQLNSDECKLQPTEEEKNNESSYDSYAVFGMCVNPVNPKEGHCLWSRDECPSTYTWVTPTKDNYCKCDRVDVGACRFGEEYICAVSANACEDVSQYVGTKRLKEIRPDTDCRLCKDISTDTTATQITSGQQQELSTANSEGQQYMTVSPIQNEDATLGCPLVPSNGCSICGEGMCISNPDTVFQYPGDPAIKCKELEEAGYQGEIPLEFCPLFAQTNMPEVCGCSSIGLNNAVANVVDLKSANNNTTTHHRRKVPIVAIVSCIVFAVAVYVVVSKVEAGRRKSCFTPPSLSSTNSSDDSNHGFPSFPPGPPVIASGRKGITSVILGTSNNADKSVLDLI